MHFTDVQLLAWLQQFFWPFARITSALMVVPVFGSRQISSRIRLALALLLTLVLAPLLPLPPSAALWSSAWWMTLVQQLATGMLLGFVLLLSFEAITLAAELISSASGLSFAQQADPLRGVVVPVVAQFMTLFATLMFLALGGHLLIIEWLARSFALLPIGGDGLGVEALGALLKASGQLFVGGLTLALPVMLGLLLINLALGVIGRSAPSLNLFAIGFPLTLGAALLMLLLAWSSMSQRIVGLFDEAWLLMAQLFGAK